MLHGLTDADLALVKELVQAHRDRSDTPRRGDHYSVDHEETFAPETYLARTPTGGIPALGENTTGTGTTDELDDSIGYADCEIYKVVKTGNTSYRLEKLRGRTHKVFNPAPVPIPERQLVLITRDKFGTWFVTAPWLDFGTCD